MSEIKKQWYVIRAIGGKEGKVKEYIEAEIRHNHLEDLHFPGTDSYRKSLYYPQRKEDFERKSVLSGLRPRRGCLRRANSDHHSQHPQCAGLPRRHQGGQPQDDCDALRPQEGSAHSRPGRRTQRNGGGEQGFPSLSARPSRLRTVLSRASKVLSRQSTTSARNSRYR